MVRGLRVKCVGDILCTHQYTIQTVFGTVLPIHVLVRGQCMRVVDCRVRVSGRDGSLLFSGIGLINFYTTMCMLVVRTELALLYLTELVLTDSSVTHICNT